MYILGPFRPDAETDTLPPGSEPVSLGRRAVDIAAGAGAMLPRLGSRA